MAKFTINRTDFGVAPQRSHCQVTRSLFRGRRLDVEVEGDPERFAQVKGEEGSEWSWALYPPSFRLRSYPVPRPTAGRVTELRLTRSDIEKHDATLYLMEHNPVENVVIEVGPGDEITIAGDVSLLGEPATFRIEWQS
jgi:hypothetical protein